MYVGFNQATPPNRHRAKFLSSEWVYSRFCRQDVIVSRLVKLHRLEARVIVFVHGPTTTGDLSPQTDTETDSRPRNGYALITGGVFSKLLSFRQRIRSCEAAYIK